MGFYLLKSTSHTIKLFRVLGVNLSKTIMSYPRESAIERWKLMVKKPPKVMVQWYGL
jgi:hypothetical protein